jgi:RNA polymerase sigma-70 factor (ECF subfamily)
MSKQLHSLAYRMLGSVADAQDVLQEAELKLFQADPRPDNPEAFMYRVVSNLCVDRLRKEKVRRKDYFGPWLPEPLVEDSAEVAELAQELSLGFVLMLERLSPGERIVFVLREGFDFSFAEIAEILGVSTANARQRAHRARKRLADGRMLTDAPAQEQKSLLEALLMRMAERDVDGIVALMSDDVVAYADGGGVVSAAIAPITGAARITQVALHITAKADEQGPLEFRLTRMNGGWGAVVTQNAAVHSCLQIDVADGRIQSIYMVRNPEKLTQIQ